MSIAAMNAADVHEVALCIWREARGEGNTGMSGVASVIRNRALKRGQSPKDVVLARFQFSSMDPGDPQATNYPESGDVQFAWCQKLAGTMSNTAWYDATLGATLYYDTSIEFPASWNRNKVQETVQIGRLKFWREL